MPGLLRLAPEVPVSEDSRLPDDRPHAPVMSTTVPILANTTAPQMHDQEIVPTVTGVETGVPLFQEVQDDDIYYYNNHMRGIPSRIRPVDQQTRSTITTAATECVEVQEWLLGRYGFLRGELESVERELSTLSRSIERHTSRRRIPFRMGTGQNHDPDDMSDTSSIHSEASLSIHGDSLGIHGDALGIHSDAVLSDVVDDLTLKDLAADFSSLMD